MNRGAGGRQGKGNRLEADDCKTGLVATRRPPLAVRSGKACEGRRIEVGGSPCQGCGVGWGRGELSQVLKAIAPGRPLLAVRRVGLGVGRRVWGVVLGDGSGGNRLWQVAAR